MFRYRLVGAPMFPRGAYFSTVVTERRQPIRIHADIRLALCKAIALERKMLPFRIDGWALLLNHLHVIWILDDADSPCWRLIKHHAPVSAAPRPSDRAACREAVWHFLAASLLGASDPRRAGFLPASRLSARQFAEAWPGRAGRRLVVVQFSSLGEAGVYPADWVGVGSDGGAGRAGEARAALATRREGRQVAPALPL